MDKKYYQNRLSEIQARLKGKKLVWFGVRGTDSRSLLQLESFKEVYSIIAPLESLSLDFEMCLELEKKRRVDLDDYRIDDDTSSEALNMHDKLISSLSVPAYLASYRPAKYLASVYFPRIEYVDYLGIFHEKQAPFEYKPWVETELAKVNVNTIPWNYVEDGNITRLKDLMRNGHNVLRPNRSDGGMGIILADDLIRIEDWQSGSEHFIGAAPFINPSIPLNVNAVVFRNGKVSLHAPSLQLIGIKGFTARRFGYCGNDFSTIRELGKGVLKRLEVMTKRASKWLAKNGYIGAFGIDAIYAPHDDELYITEINPRFQGSSDISAEIDQRMERTDMFLEHIAAHLGMSPPPHIPLAELASNQPKISHVICHNTEKETLTRTNIPIKIFKNIRLMLAPRLGINVDKEAILFRAVISDSVTKDGLSLNEPYSEELLNIKRDMFII